MDAANGILSSEGYLVLKEDLIQKNPSHRRSVRRLKLDYSMRGGSRKIGDSIGEFEELTHLSIHDHGTVTHLSDNLTSLRKLKVLDLDGCYELPELPPNLGELYTLTSLSLRGCNTIESLPGSLEKLSNLTDLFISNCDSLEELPKNLGKLESLTHFTLHYCRRIKFLPSSVAKLPKLTTLTITECYDLQELPENMGELKSLTHFTLHYCRSIKFLPSSVAKLPKLTTLTITECYDLQELPANMGELESLTHFTLVHCDRIKLLPKLPNKLTTLTIKFCDALQELPADMGELKSLTHVFIQNCGFQNDCPLNLNLVDLKIKDCCSIQPLPRGLSNLKHLYLPLCINREERLANLKYCVSLRHLKFWDCSSHKPKEFPLNVDKLPQLSLLDIQDTRIKCLPSSITKLSKLRLLLLPCGFLLDTLPYDLDESLVISVKFTHVRKTWKELKTELEIFSSHTVGEMAVDPSKYVSLTGDPAPWIENNSTELSTVRILDLDLTENRALNITDSIAKLAELTHLFISGGSLSQLPLTLTRITHISLVNCEFECNMKSGFDSLGKLYTLKSLELYGMTILRAHVDLPVSLRHLSLGCGHINFTPLLDSMTKLSNLKALHLFRIEQFDSLPKNLNLEKLELVDCYVTNINSLPGGLRHLEILHSKEMCNSKCSKSGTCINQLVDVETLSVTSHCIKFLPSVAGLHNVQELQLKDCFSIKQLPPNLDVMVNLCTLNLSGTRIKSLPHSILKLPKLQCLILPKCFQPGSLPLEFRNQSLVSFDNTDDKYYEDYDSNHETSDDNTTNTIEVVSEVVSKESEEGITSQQQISSHKLLDQPDATPVFKDPKSNDEMTIQDKTDVSYIGNSLNKKRRTLEENKKRKKPRGKGKGFTLEEIERLVVEGRTVSEAGRILGVSESTLKRRCRELGIKEWPSIRQHRTNMRKASNIDGLSQAATSQNVTSCVTSESNVVVNDSTPDETVRAEKEPPMKSQGRYQQGQEHLNDTKESAPSTTGQPKSSWSNCIVKAHFEENGDIVRFEFPLSSNIDQLKYEIGRKLELEVGKFKIKYKDDDGDWVSVTCITDLKHARSLSKSDVVRLSVISKT